MKLILMRQRYHLQIIVVLQLYISNVTRTDSCKSLYYNFTELFSPGVFHCLYYKELYNVCHLVLDWSILSEVWFSLTGHMRDKAHG